jgi:signal transduction histidine kinase
VEALWAGLGTTLVGVDPPSPRTRSARATNNLRVFWWVVAVSFGLIFYGGLATDGRHHMAPAILWVLSLAVAAPLTLLPRRPLMAWRIAWLTGLVSVPLHTAPGTAQVPWHPVLIITMLVVLLAVGMRHPFPVLVPVWLLTGTLIAFAARPQDRAGWIIAITVALVLGDQIRRRGEAQRGLRTQAELKEEEQARRAVLEERARIARDMHDVVAHHMSLIAVRAESAPYRLAEATAESTAAEFAAIAEEARLSLAEMRRLLGVLRQGNNGPELAPQPGLEQIPELISNAQAAGVWVALRWDGEIGTVPEAVGLTSYRIVQEALANAGRHAPGALVQVRVRGEAEQLRVTVANGPATLPVPEPTDGAPHGLVGMRERVAVLGGTFEAGPSPDGGFLVRATLPRRGAR